MHADALDAAAPTRRHLGLRRRAGNQSVEPGRREAGQHSPVPAARLRRAALRRRCPVPDAVDARKLGDQRPRSSLVVDLALREADRESSRRDATPCAPDASHYLIRLAVPTTHTGAAER